MPRIPDQRSPEVLASTESTKESPNPAQLSVSNGVSKDVSSIALTQPASRLLGLQDSTGAPAGKLASSKSYTSPALLESPTGELSDTELMLQVQAGDDSAFDLLVHKFRQPMVNFMYRMARNQGVAEELAQEVFLRVYRSRQSYAAEAKFSTWLYRVATNLALNHIRDTRNERAGASISLDEPDEESGRTIDLADKKRSVEENLLRRERMLAIRRHVEELPERQRLAVILHKYQEMDYREISKVLKMSESATKSLLFRAYETLREKLKDFV